MNGDSWSQSNVSLTLSVSIEYQVIVASHLHCTLLRCIGVCMMTPDHNTALGRCVHLISEYNSLSFAGRPGCSVCVCGLWLVVCGENCTRPLVRGTVHVLARTARPLHYLSKYLLCGVLDHPCTQVAVRLLLVVTVRFASNLPLISILLVLQLHARSTASRLKTAPFCSLCMLQHVHAQKITFSL